jgi:hypothetical protein
MKARVAEAVPGVKVVHDIPGRVRLRLPRLRRDAKDATAIADHLAGLDGMIDVQVRLYTGSVLCRYDAETLSRDAILSAVRDLARAGGVEADAAPGDGKGRTGEPLRRSSLAHEVTRAFRGYNRDVLAATEGRLDLGILAVMGFFAAGAIEVAVSRRLPAPPWFNLAWWAFQTFTAFEREAGGAAEPAGEAGRRASRPRTLQAKARRRLHAVDS